MTPEQFELARRFFHDLASKADVERSAILADLRGRDPAVAARLDSLLHQSPPGGWLESPSVLDHLIRDAAAVRVEPFGERAELAAGDRVGSYTILSELGRGGFGAVYLARQVDPDRTVALKILQRADGAGALLLRFAQERQALAVMNHPCIAKIYDAGRADDGRPFFTMEHVDGCSITEACDRARLTIRERLELFVRVCDAVQHAHDRGVIHRDLKPSNILASAPEASGARRDGPGPESAAPTGSGGTAAISVKVIDFGIAKALTPLAEDQATLTEAWARVGTPAYMSPEQTAGNADIDTRTDVYSLGVILFEQLVGARPFDPPRRLIPDGVAADPPAPAARFRQPGIDQAAAAASRSATPASLFKLLRSDVRWITAKALAPDRARRYARVADLAEDIRSFLATGTLQHAAPPSRGYRARRFVKRHRAAVIAGSAITVALMLGLAGTSYGLMRAESKRVEAELRQGEAQQVADFQADMLAQLDPATLGARLVHDIGDRYRETLARRSMPESVRESNVEDLEVHLNRINATDIAVGIVDQSILAPAVRALDQRYHDKPKIDAILRLTIADTYERLGLYETAIPIQERVVAIREADLGRHHRLTLRSLINMANLLLSARRLDKAEVILDEVLTDLRGQFGSDDPDAITALANLGTLIRERDGDTEAEPYYREVLERRRRVLGPDDQDTLISLSNMGFLLDALNKREKAESCYREAVEGKRRVMGEFHPSTLLSINGLGLFLLQQGRYDEAEPFLRISSREGRRVLGESNPKVIEWINNMGLLLRRQGKFDEAAAQYQDALALARRSLGDKHRVTLRICNNIGMLYCRQKMFTEAEPYLRETLETKRKLLDPTDPDLLVSVDNMAVLLSSQGKPEEAEPYAREAVEGYIGTMGDDRNDSLIAVHTLGGILTKLGSFADAEELLTPAAERAEKLGPRHPTCISLLKAVVELYGAWDEAAPGQGFADRAAEWQSKLDELTSPPATDAPK